MLYVPRGTLATTFGWFTIGASLSWVRTPGKINPICEAVAQRRQDNNAKDQDDRAIALAHHQTDH